MDGSQVTNQSEVLCEKSGVGGVFRMQIRFVGVVRDMACF
jgi:hypothetical protein